MTIAPPPIKITYEAQKRLFFAVLKKDFRARRISNAEFAKLVRMPSANVSRMLSNNGGNASVQKMTECLVLLGYDVHTTIKPTPTRRQGTVKVTVCDED